METKYNKFLLIIPEKEDSSVVNKNVIVRFYMDENKDGYDIFIEVTHYTDTFFMSVISKKFAEKAMKLIAEQLANGSNELDAKYIRENLGRC